MNERLRSLSDEELGRALREADAFLDRPTTPDVVQGLTSRLLEQRHGPRRTPPRLPMPRGRRALVLAIAITLVIAAAAFAAKLVIDLGALTVDVVPGRPTSLPSAPAADRDFGRAVTLVRAQAIAGFSPRIPSALGPPDQVWVDRAVTSFETSEPATRIVLAWSPSPGLPAIPGTDRGALLMAFSGSADTAAKVVFAETGSIRHATVRGADAYWVVGRHELDLLGPDGLEPRRVTGNVLLWNDDGIVLRLETVVNERAAIEIAGSG